MRLRIISIASSVIVLVGITIVGYQFKLHTLFASSGGQVDIGNDTQSVAIVNASAIGYEKQVKTRSNNLETQRFRDHVVTLKNNSSREILAYSFECENKGSKFPKRGFGTRLLFTEYFLPQTTHVRKFTTSDGASCRLNAVIFSGFIYEGKRDIGEQFVANLRGTQNKLISLCNQLKEILELSNDEYINAIRAFSSDIQSQIKGKGSNSAIIFPSNMSKEDAAQQRGEIDAIHLIKSAIDAAVRSDNASTSKLIVNNLLQQCDSFIKRVEPN